MSHHAMKRLERLEKRRLQPSLSGGLDCFYNMPEWQREQMMAPMYGGERKISREEAERVYREIME